MRREGGGETVKQMRQYSADTMPAISGGIAPLHSCVVSRNEWQHQNTKLDIFGISASGEL